MRNRKFGYFLFAVGKKRKKIVLLIIFLISTRNDIDLKKEKLKVKSGLTK